MEETKSRGLTWGGHIIEGERVLSLRTFGNKVHKEENPWVDSNLDGMTT